MNSLFVKTLPLCLCLFVFSAQAQTSTPSPVYRSEPSDTNYRPTDEDAYRHVHETVTIIDKKRLMPDGSYKTEKAYIHHRKTKEGNAISDTTSQAEAAGHDTNAIDAAVAPIVPVIVDMPSDTAKPTGNRELLFGGLSLIVLALLLALFLILGRDKKRPTPISVIQAVSMATGLSILLAYCICLSAFACGTIVLLIAAMTGAAVLTNDLNERQNPTWLVGSHIVLTIIGIVIIVLAAFMH